MSRAMADASDRFVDRIFARLIGLTIPSGPRGNFNFLEGPISARD